MAKDKKATRKECWPYKVKSFNDMLAHPTKSYKTVAQALKDNQPIDSIKLSELTGFNQSTVRGVIKFCRDNNLIYISQWGVPTKEARLAMYSVGNKPDAERPDRLFKYRPSKKDKTPLVFTKVGLADMKELAAALVPKRTPEEQAEVNRLYLNWISEGMYG